MATEWRDTLHHKEFFLSYDGEGEEEGQLGVPPEPVIYMSQELCDKLHTPLEVGAILLVKMPDGHTSFIYVVKEYDYEKERFKLEWPD